METFLERDIPHPASYRDSSRVLFPRFQKEDFPFRPVHLRKAEHISDKHSWLSIEQIKEIINPQRVVGEEVSRDKGAWWGERHTRRASMSDFQMFPDGKIYLSWTVRHDYLWDFQSINGRSYEVLLEAAEPGLFNKKPALKEMAALLVEDTLKPESQRLVINAAKRPQAKPIWEPAPVPEVHNIDRDYLLFVMRSLATQPALAEVSKR